MEKQFDAQRHLFEEGGKLHWAWPLFEGQETFFLTPRHKTKHGTHVRDRMDMKRLMIFVLYALAPAILLGMYNVGYQGYLAEGATGFTAVQCITRGLVAMLPVIITSYAAGGLAELVFCIVRKHEINEGFLVTAMLFPLTLPPTIPLWMVAVGIIFGVVIGKEVFGGVGMNILNPALTARAFVFFTYPAAISGAGVWDVGGKDLFATADVTKIDAYTGATPLLTASSATGSPVDALTAAGWDWGTMAMGFIPGSMGEVSAVAAALGAVFLIATGIASWRIMLGCVAGLLTTAAILNGIGSDTNVMMSLPPHYHLVMGGFMFGTVFMATDPCSSAVTPMGRLIYGFFIGALCVLVRVVNPAYPEGMMLAILFMNVFAPLIDYFIVRRTTRARAARMATA
ncbi:MAG: NADH:ubiquinone reductase (Na(+)-transporting) subunit B [Alphaproteobacteria bacterium]|nr:NADH:ubiquinone reductase (Na(+)-transporting) subunit B [Alphaproteobacteria bacterium]MCB9694856.1 NADH:ubiquinone reductase (Na(+)-transporting) subunit B [Alphaproteobacteria bacterium]